MSQHSKKSFVCENRVYHMKGKLPLRQKKLHICIPLLTACSTTHLSLCPWQCRWNHWWGISLQYKEHSSHHWLGSSASNFLCCVLATHKQSHSRHQVADCTVPANLSNYHAKRTSCGQPVAHNLNLTCCSVHVSWLISDTAKGSINFMCVLFSLKFRQD